MKLRFVFLTLALVCAFGALREAPAWHTYRGNTQRTGNTDNLAGPASPRVLWKFEAREHFVAAPVPYGDGLLVSGLGAFNVPTLYHLAADPKAPQRVLWSKSVPYLKLPVVSSPAVFGDQVAFGDGMHQTDGARLHCLSGKTGLPLWQLQVPGTLVHLEGTPTIAGSRLVLGGGAAGVLCVDTAELTLDGKKITPFEAHKLLEKQWHALLAKFEIDKKKDPDFAVPPNEDQLPRPSPRRVWQQGEGKWHVDAPLAVVDHHVLAASAFLDKEKVGDRALYSLDSAKGTVRWRAPLKFNPWSGPSVLGDLVVVGGSTIGYDTRALKGAKGELSAFRLVDGKEQWRKEVPGGILSSVALVGNVAIATATDGKVRAFDLATGDRKWIYDGAAPFFAGPAVVQGVVYAGDLRGVVHAIDLNTGQAKWKLDLGADPAVKSPGMIYGSPIVHGGRLFVATCNLEGPAANRPTAVVCVGEK